MIRNRLRLWYLVTVLISISFLSSCTGRPYLIVDYQVPLATQQLKGQTTTLRIDDQRSNHAILSPQAAIQFQDFKERYSLAWITADQGRILAGEHDLTALFQTTFEKRLMMLGATIAPIGDSTAPQMVIVLETFNIKLQGRKWLADVGYRAILTAEGHPVAKEYVRGNAERIRVIGRKGADMVISDIFTDVVNRLDVAKLFQNADLIP